MKSFQVIRTHLSPYQSQDFSLREQKIVEKYHHIYRKIDQPLERDVILITNTHTKLSTLPKTLIEKTKLIIHPNSGYENFEESKSLVSTIPLVIGHEVRAQGVTEYIMHVLKHAIGQLSFHDSWSPTRVWSRRLISDLRVLILGYGHVGMRLEKILESYGAKVFVFDPYKRKVNEPPFEEIDVLVSTMSSNEANSKFINSDYLQKFRNDLIVINPSRGSVVHESDLKSFMRKNSSARAYLDVFEDEPFSTSDWENYPNIYKTSHIAGVDQFLDQRILHFVDKTLSDFTFLNEQDFLKKYQDELFQNKLYQGRLI